MRVDYDLEEIKKRISRYDFINRIKIIQYLSYCSIGFEEEFKKGIRRQPPTLQPWDVETIATICLYYPNESSIRRYFATRDFIVDINYIIKTLGSKGGAVPPRYLDYIDTYGAHSIFGPIFRQQMGYQEYINAKLFRYRYILNYDKTIRQFVRNKIGPIDYEELFVFATLPKTIKETLLLENNLINSVAVFDKYQQFINIITKRLSRYIFLLSITRDEFIAQQSEKCDMTRLNEIAYSYKTINEKPFLDDGKRIYMLTSHSLEYACSDGLFLSLVNGNLDMIRYIGGTAVEAYINYIVRESNLYKMVSEEEVKKKYYVKKQEFSPPDCIFKTNEEIVFIEIKECLPKRTANINDELALERIYETAIKATKQCLINYINFKKGNYNPFGDSDDKNKTPFFIVTTLLYNCVNNEYVISEVIKDKRFKPYEELLKKHLVITDFHNLELFFLFKEDIVADLKQKSLSNKMNTFGSSHGTKLAENRILDFDKYVRESNELGARMVEEIVKEYEKNNE